MRAFAPGKLVLSGAYSVLAGAPAIVSAVDRYVASDSSRSAEFVTPEVKAALGAGAAPYFDASALRDGGQKLGLGSSAAILVASLAAVRGGASESEVALRHALWEPALLAHRQAQGGGSGIDVAASIWGGTLLLRRSAEGRLDVQQVELPPDLVVETWSSGVSASTSELLASVARLRARAPSDYTCVMKSLIAAAEAAARAVEAQQTQELVAALDAQRLGLAQLGRAAEADIITPAVARLADLARAHGAAVLPSGAGGGDIVLWAGTRASPTEFRTLAAVLQHRLVPLELHARGVYVAHGEVGA